MCHLRLGALSHFIFVNREDSCTYRTKSFLDPWLLIYKVLTFLGPFKRIPRLSIKMGETPLYVSSNIPVTSTLSVSKRFE
jgi:hypothetical protein